jgi:NAD(P)-dependent dehydrogenase (short-subunit alcohol dehydrogenase family)
MPRRTIVITGASDGIGKGAARKLAAHGERVVLVGRSRAKTEALAAELDAPYELADFAVLDEVRALADRLLERFPVIDVLANNAGGVAGSEIRTVDGHEWTFQVDHLSPFLLTHLLDPALVAGHATIIQTASIANVLFSKLDLDDLDLERGWTANRAYGNAKLANILFTRELQARRGEDGLAAVAFHPGVLSTNFAAEATGILKLLYRTPLKHFFTQPAGVGVDRLVHLAEGRPGSDWQPGSYYDGTGPGRVSRTANDPTVASRLWERSADMLGL